MSNTPRTDAVEFYAGDLDGGQEAVSADFARELERELGRAKASLATLAGVVTARDALLESLQQFLGCMELSGQWDDGCFYYSGMAAPELQDVIFKARAAVKKARGE